MFNYSIESEEIYVYFFKIPSFIISSYVAEMKLYNISDSGIIGNVAAGNLFSLKQDKRDKMIE